MNSNLKVAMIIVVGLIMRLLGKPDGKEANEHPVGRQYHGNEKNNQQDKEDISRNNLNKYEVRHPEVAESSEQINGIFFIYNGAIVPDYFSECLATDKSSFLANERHHDNFYKNYIKNKFPDLPQDEKYLPRGRVNLVMGRTDIYIDKCYFKDEYLISQICELYRTKGKTSVFWNFSYECNVCKNLRNDEMPFQSYTLEKD